MSQDYEAKWKEQKAKYDSLFKMQKTLLADTDQYLSIFAALHSLVSPQATALEPDDIDPTTAHQLLQNTIDALANTSSTKQCDCQRWKQLYQQQCNEAAKVQKEKIALLDKIKEKQRQQELDNLEMTKLLQEYLQLYRKEVAEIGTPNAVVGSGKKAKSKERSRSKGHTANVNQTQRPSKGGKGQEHSAWVLSRLQTECISLRAELQQVRATLQQKQSQLGLYRAKQRKHLLAGGQLLD